MKKFFISSILSTCLIFPSFADNVKIGIILGFIGVLLLFFDKLVLNLLPEEYKIENVNLYDRIMQVCSYVSGISDSYAIRIHKKLLLVSGPMVNNYLERKNVLIILLFLEYIRV